LHPIFNFDFGFALGTKIMRENELSSKIEKVLPFVQRPSRYINREWNAVHKDPRKVAVKVALAYPDLYEVGLSNLGLQILYEILNEREDVLAERVYAPWVDMEREMRQANIPLFSLESQVPVCSFDIFGFSLQYELTYTNILNMLDLAQIPLRAVDRGEEYPLVIGGGPCAFNPEPLAPFFDLFVIGEGEEVILELVEEYMKVQSPKSKVQGPKDEGKENLLKALAQISGVYVPSFYQVEYHSSGQIKKIYPITLHIPPKVTRRVMNDLNKARMPKQPIVPFVDVAHNRGSVEIMRGCTRGCRFCQAGIIYRPVRERECELLAENIKGLIEATGYEEISLASLSSADYSSISQILKSLAEVQDEKKVAISLPSLRVDTFSVNLAREIQKVKKTGLTFAPEAGSQRLRDLINKCTTDENLFQTVEAAFREGWRRLKLYFMIGLPAETREDLQAIVNLAQKVVEIGLAIIPKRERRRLEIIVNVSSFVPKAHTPFQWLSQNTMKELLEKQDFLKKNLKGRYLSLRWHDVNQSLLEGALARGDRRLSEVIERAWQSGARFDAWP